MKRSSAFRPGGANPPAGASAPLDALGLWLLLAILASIPGLELIAVGLLFEREGRVARGEGLGAALAASPRMRRLWAIALGTTIVFAPIVLLRAALRDAAVAHGSTPIVAGSIIAALGAIAGAHAGAAALEGRFAAFLSPRSTLRSLRDGATVDLRALLGALRSLLIRLIELFGRGLVSVLGSALWFLPAAAALALRADSAWTVVSVGLGALMSAAVLSWLPFLQAHAAAERRWSAFLEVQEIRRRMRRAPLAHLFGLLVWTLSTLPLDALLIFDLPREARVLAAWATIGLLVPARFAAAWAYAAGARAEREAWPVVRAGAFLARAPLVFLTVFASLLLPYVAAHGTAAVLESAAFLLPLPR